MMKKQKPRIDSGFFVSFTLLIGILLSSAQAKNLRIQIGTTKQKEPSNLKVPFSSGGRQNILGLN